jgi:hypothetical protein
MQKVGAVFFGEWLWSLAMLAVSPLPRRLMPFFEQEIYRPVGIGLSAVR